MYAKQKRYGEAIDAWNRYVRATNDDATGYANLGFCLELAGRTEEAEIAYRKGIKRDPTNAPCRVNYGLLLARHDRINEAMLEMQAVLPEAQVHYNLASVYEGMGRREQAKAEYRKAWSAFLPGNEYRRLVEIKLNAVGVDPKSLAPVVTVTPAAPKTP